MSRDSTDKDKHALPTLETDITKPPDADGLEPSEVPESSEDSTEDLKDAPSGRKEPKAETYAGTTDLLSSEDSVEEQATALSTEDSIDNTLDAPKEEQVNPQQVEEVASD